ncbi:MAG: hypothetical protein H6618_08315 [Deltaproteobacteria bacterium]|nr:hypothetical protein [Deltaproteobacteria bacterium]
MKAEQDPCLWFYIREYEAVRKDCQERIRLKELKEELTLNRDCYQVTPSAHELTESPLSRLLQLTCIFFSINSAQMQRLLSFCNFIREASHSQTQKPESSRNKGNR